MEVHCLYEWAILRGKGRPKVKYRDSAVSCSKTAEPIEIQQPGMRARVVLKKHVLDGSAHWSNLANMTESFKCDGDAAFLSNYFGHLL